MCCPPATGDFDLVFAMANLAVQVARKMDLPSWLPSRELSSWTDYADHTTAISGRLQGFLGAKTKVVIPGVAHRGAVPDIEHAESARWLRALPTESRLLRRIACSAFWFIEAKKPWPENPTSAFRWQSVDDRALLCVEEVARAGISSHLSCHFDGFMVHRDVPPVTSSHQFLLYLATQPADHHGVHHPFRLEGALLLHTAPSPCRPADAQVDTPRGAFRPGRQSGTHLPRSRSSCARRSVSRSRKMRAAL